MSSAQSHRVTDAENSIEFDQLCHICESLFDEEVIWEKNLCRPHHDIFSLASSAAHGCHICSLILNQIWPENIKRLQQDLAELVTHPSQQIAVNISGVTRFSLAILARGSTLLENDKIGFSKPTGWSII